MAVIAERVRRRFEEAQDVWYCVEYAAPAPPSPIDPMRDQDVNGLVFQHWVERDGHGSSRLLSYWSSRNKFTDHRAPFERRLGLGEPLAEGYVRNFKIQRSPRWKRIARLSLKTITGATALFGLWTVVKGVLGPWAALPDVDVFVQAPDRGIEGQEFQGELKIKNQGEHRVKVDLLGLGWQPISGVPAKGAQVGPSDWSGWVAIDAERPIPLAGKLPVRRGVYSLRAETKAGVFRHDHDSVQHSIRVWPKEPFVEFELAALDTPTRAKVRGDIELGSAAPRGLVCDAIVNEHPRVRFDRVPVVFPDGRDGRPTVSYDTPAGKAVAFLRWWTVELKEFTEPRFKINLAAETPVDWNAVAADMEIRCSSRREEE